MSVIIRLQNLPWSANALDIRGFFRGLAIPDGGVHIVGGEMGDAFIAFSTDEDARQAMMLDGKKLKEVQIKLLLSSRAEMQKVIETARQSSISVLQIPSTQKISIVAPEPPVITTSSLNNLLTQPNLTSASQKGKLLRKYENSVASQSDSSYESRDGREKSAIEANINSGYKRQNKYTDRYYDRSRSSSRSRSTSRSGSRDRRRSRSKDRDRNGRRRQRSRSHSVERRDRKRRSSSTERSPLSNKRNYGNDNNRDSGKKRTEVTTVGQKNQMSSLENIKTNQINMWNIPPKILQNPIGYPSPAGSNPVTQNLNQMQMNHFAAFSNILPMSNQQQQQQLEQLLKQQQQRVQNQTPKPLFSLPMGQSQSLNENMYQYPISNIINPAQTEEHFKTTNINHQLPQQQASVMGLSSLQNTYNFSQFNNRNNNQNQFDSSNRRESNFSAMTLQSSTKKPFNQDDVSTKHENRQRSCSPSRSRSPSSAGNWSSRDPREKKTDKAHDEMESNCIKISNMCPSTSYSELRRFFSGLFIANNGIKLINDKNGERTGTGFIRFVKKESKPKAFVRNNSVFKNKRVIIESVTEDDFEAAVDSYKPSRTMRRPKSPVRKENRNEKAPGTTELEAIGDKPQERFTCLFLQELPPFAKEQDIIKMFSSYVLFDILLTREKDNRRQFVCYVKFHRAEDAKNALEDTSKHKIAHKNIAVSACSDENFEKAKKIYSIQDESPGDIASEREIHTDQDQRQVVDKQASFINENIEAQDSNVESNRRNNNNNTNNNRTAEIPSLFSLKTVPPTSLPSDPRRRSTARQGTRFSNPDDNKNKTRYAMLKNCDYRTRQRDFQEFFAKVGIIPSRIEILNNNRNQPSGDCIVEFQNINDAEKSLFQNNAICDGRPIRIELISENVVAEHLGENFLRQSRLLTSHQNITNINTENKNLSFDANIHDQIINFICSQYGSSTNMCSGINNQTNNPEQNTNIFDERSEDNILNRQNPFRNNSSSTIVGIHGNNEAFNQSCNNTRRQGRPSRFSDADNIGNKNRFIGNNDNHLQMPILTELNNSTVDSFGQPGCVVGMENVPFKADTNDILEFFKEFNVQARNVIRRYNDDGSPTGDARVAFNSPIEARTAIEHKRLQKIFNRTIYLSIV